MEKRGECKVFYPRQFMLDIALIVINVAMSILPTLDLIMID